MRNKLILILLTVFVVGSLTGITAYTSLSQEDKYDAVGKVKNYLRHDTAYKQK